MISQELSVTSFEVKLELEAAALFRVLRPFALVRIFSLLCNFFVIESKL